MTPDQFFNLLQADLLPLIGKLFLLLIIFLYGVFAAVVLRQVQLMNTVVTEANFSPILFTTALVHFLAVVVVFVFAIVLV